MFEFLKTVGVLKLGIFNIIFILMCDLGNKQERIGYGLTAKCLCVRLTRDQRVLGSFMSAWQLESSERRTSTEKMPPEELAVWHFKLVIDMEGPAH